MSLTDVLKNLPDESKGHFLEELLPRVHRLSNADSEAATEAAFGESEDLGVEYLLARGEKEEAITVLGKSGKIKKAAFTGSEFVSSSSAS